MKLRTFFDRDANVITVVIIVFVTLALWIVHSGHNLLEKDARACEAKGGVYVKTPTRGMVCVTARVIP